MFGSHRHQIGLESIDFQGGSLFFKELVLFFTALRKFEKESELLESDNVANFTAIVKKKTGLSIAIDFASGYGPAIMVPDVNKHNVLFNTARQNMASNVDAMHIIAKSGNVMRGSVDLKNSTVSGCYSDLAATMYYPSNMVMKASRFTPEECAAICLHEIGHFFTYLEYIAHTVRTNTIMAGLSAGLDKAGTVEEREAVLMTVKKAADLKKLDVKDAAQIKDGKVTEIVVLTAIADSVRDELGQNIYNLNTWEYLCDEFAARHGAGRHIATGLDKLYRSIGHIATRSFPVYLGVEALKFTMLISGAISFFALSGIAGWIGKEIFAASFFLFGVDGIGDETYDRPMHRIARVRNQLIEELKDKKLPHDRQKQLLEDLKVVDDILERMNDRLQILNVMWGWVSKHQRDRLAQEKLSRELEDVAINKLFAKAAELRTI